MRDCDEKYGVKSPFSEFNSLNILVKMVILLQMENK
jgi:hypothetical protein